MKVSNQKAILDVLAKFSPISRADLIKKTGVVGKPLWQAIFLLKKSKQIVDAGDLSARFYGLPGTDFPASLFHHPNKNDQPKNAAAPKAEKKPPTAKFAPANAEKAGKALVVPQARQPLTVSPDDIRAIRTHDGGAIVLQGGFLVNELTADQTRAIQALA